MDYRASGILRPFQRALARTTLRFQLLAIVFGTLAAAFVLSSWVNTRVERRALEEVRAYVESTSRAVQVSVNGFRNQASGVEILTFEAEAVPAGIRSLTLRDASGRIVARNVDTGVATPADDTHLVSYRIPLVEAGRLTGYLDVELTTSGLSNVFTEMVWSKVILWSGIFLLGGLVLWPVASAIGQSHRQVEVLAASVARGDLDPDFPEPMSREAEGLFSSFRSLLARLREQRDIEQQLRRSEREASIGRMTSGVAHDIRNPLNYVELAVGELWRKRQGLGSPSPAEEALYSGVRQELRRVGTIASDLLAFGRPVIPHLRNEDADDILLQCRNDIGRRRPDRGKDVALEAEDDIRVVADSDLLRRALTNVIENALDATGPGDRVKVGCRGETDEVVLFRVADSGPGVSQEIVDHVFEPYLTSKPSGTGLGLALAHQWIVDMGGTISLENRPEGGTQVDIRLPRADGRPS